jgi:hypothetical protein
MSIPALITNFVTIATLFKQVLIFLSLRQPDWPSPATGASPWLARKPGAIWRTSPTS